MGFVYDRCCIKPGLMPLLQINIRDLKRYADALPCNVEGNSISLVTTVTEGSSTELRKSSVFALFSLHFPISRTNVKTTQR